MGTRHIKTRFRECLNEHVTDALRNLGVKEVCRAELTDFICDKLWAAYRAQLFVQMEEVSCNRRNAAIRQYVEREMRLGDLLTLEYVEDMCLEFQEAAIEAQIELEEAAGQPASEPTEAELAALEAEVPTEEELAELEQEVVFLSEGGFLGFLAEEAKEDDVVVVVRRCNCGADAIAYAVSADGGDDVTLAREGQPAHLRKQRANPHDYLGINPVIVS